MNTRLLPILALFVATSANAQTKETAPAPKSKQESITIRKKSDSKEKVTIIIDGDNITVNGKPVEDMKSEDIEILRNKGIGPLMPKIKARIAPMMGGMKMLREAGNRAFLGVVTEKTEKGAKINSVEKESAAEKAGLKKEDIITKVGDNKIEGSDDLYEAIGKYKPEEKVSITYLRDGKQATANATLGKNQSSDVRVFNFNNKDFNFDDKDFNFDNKDFNFQMPKVPGMNGMDITYNRKPRLGLEIQDLEEGKGVKILDVDNDTPASKAGLQKDDVVTEVDGAAITSVDDLRSKIRDKKEGDSFKITYRRNGNTQTADIKFPKKLKTADL
jgi:serine protease Do